MVKTAEKSWVSFMDNGLFELQAATASPPRDAATDRARRDRNDDDFGTLVRASDTRADRAATETSATPDHRDARGNDGQDRSAHYSDTARNDAEPPRHEDQSDPSFGGSFDEYANAEPPSSHDHGIQPEHNGLERALAAINPLTDAVVATPSPSTPTAVAAGVLDALLAGETTPVAATPAHATALNAAPVAGQAALTSLGGPGSGSGANIVLPNGDTHSAPNRPAAQPTEVQPANNAGPAQPTSPVSTDGALLQTNTPAETSADTPDTSAGSATSERPEMASGLQIAEAQVQAATTLAATVDQSPVDAPEVAASAAGALAATAAHRQSTSAAGAQPTDTDMAVDPTAPIPALAANANAAANNRPTANRPASATSATPDQQRSGIANKPTETPGAAQAGAPAAIPNDQASAVRDAALAIAADRMSASHTQRFGDAAPDLAVFRETLATVLPETAGAQMTDSIRAAGRIAAVDLVNRPQLMHPSLTDQVTIRIREAFDVGDSQVRIQLQPKELGRIDVRMDFHESGRMSAHVVAERADTLELLMRDARGLERALQQAGFDTDSNSLAFDLKEQDQQPGSQDDDSAGGELVADDGETSDEINIDLAALMQGDTSTSGVDIQV